MTPVRNAALRVEMAQGRVNAITSGGSVDRSTLEDAIFDRDSERNRLRIEVEKATGMPPADLVRALQT